MFRDKGIWSVFSNGSDDDVDDDDDDIQREITKCYLRNSKSAWSVYRSAFYTIFVGWNCFKIKSLKQKTCMMMQLKLKETLF